MMLAVTCDDIELGTGNWGQGTGTGGSKLGTLGTGNRELGAANWQQGTWDRDLGAGNWGQGPGGTGKAAPGNRKFRGTFQTTVVFGQQKPKKQFPTQSFQGLAPATKSCLYRLLPKTTRGGLKGGLRGGEGGQGIKGWLKGGFAEG